MKYLSSVFLSNISVLFLFLPLLAVMHLVKAASCVFSVKKVMFRWKPCNTAENGFTYAHNVNVRKKTNKFTRM